MPGSDGCGTSRRDASWANERIDNSQAIVLVGLTSPPGRLLCRRASVGPEGPLASLAPSRGPARNEGRVSDSVKRTHRGAE
jgi:hypothetical protein